MKPNFIFAILTFLLLSNLSIAQRPAECTKHRETIKSERVAFITSALNLSVKEAQSFWPIYNTYHEKIEAIRESKHKVLNQASKNQSKLKDTDYQPILDQYIFYVEEEARLEKQFQKDLAKVLSAKKIFQLYAAEKDFKRKLVKDLRGQKPACME